jgi:hypothetical protein
MATREGYPLLSIDVYRRQPYIGKGCSCYLVSNYCGPFNVNQSCRAMSGDRGSRSTLCCRRSTKCQYQSFMHKI